MGEFQQQPKDVVDAAGLSEVQAALAGAPELAVDLEAESMHAFRARLCFLQLGTDANIFLLDTLQQDVKAQALADYFADPSRTKFFHAAGGDLQYLAEVGVRVRGLFDTHRAATLLGWPKVGLVDLVREHVGRDLKKEHQQADFSIRPLPPELREYIADDVRYLSDIGRRVREACAKADVLEEVLLDCERMAEEAEGRPDVATFKLKLNRAGMSEQQVRLANALGQRLHELRLKWAEAEDVPMGMVLSNNGIASIVTRPPSDLKALARTPHVRGSFAREHGEEILAAIAELKQKAERGELPAEEKDRPRDPSRRRREDLLKRFRSDEAARRKVQQSVVLPNALIEDLSVAAPKSLDELRALKWFGEKRVRLYGEKVLALLRS